MKLVIFGFFRDALDKDHVHGPIKHLDKYIYAPTLRHELEEEVITEEQVRQKFTNVKSIHLYDYNQKVKEFPELNIFSSVNPVNNVQESWHAESVRNVHCDGRGEERVCREIPNP